MCDGSRLYTQASTKYLHQRLLVVLVSPPLPGIVMQRGHRKSGRASKHHKVEGEGRNESDENGYQKGEDGHDDSRSSSSSIGSSICSSIGGSEGDGGWSDDNPDRESSRRFMMGLGSSFFRRETSK